MEDLTIINTKTHLKDYIQHFLMNTKLQVVIIIAFALSIMPFVLHSVIADISEMDVKSTNLYDDRIGNVMGWDPNEIDTWFLINDKMVQPRVSTILININAAGAAGDPRPICAVVAIFKEGYFGIFCDSPPSKGSELYYTVFNQKIKVLTPLEPDPALAWPSNATISDLENTTTSLNKETIKQMLNSTS
jgi:hypothetical protein